MVDDARLAAIPPARHRATVQKLPLSRQPHFRHAFYLTASAAEDMLRWHIARQKCLFMPIFTAMPRFYFSMLPGLLQAKMRCRAAGCHHMPMMRAAQFRRACSARSPSIPGLPFQRSGEFYISFRRSRSCSMSRQCRTAHYRRANADIYLHASCRRPAFYRAILG